jgi:hypothetical protein
MTYGPKFVKEVTNKQVKVEADTFESASDSSLKDENVKVESKTSVPEKVKVEVKKSIPEVVKVEKEKPRNQANHTRPTTRYAEMYRSRSSTPRGNKRSWNHVKSQQFGSDFEFNNKSCHICGSFDHLHAYCNYHKGKREVFRNTRVNENNVNRNTHPNPLSKMIPRAVLLNSGIKSLSTARKVNRVYPKSPVKSAKPNTTFVKSTQTGKKTLYEKKVYYNQKWAPKTKISMPTIAIANSVVATARPKVSTGDSVNKNGVKLGNAVKASARWEWKPKGINTSVNPNGVLMRGNCTRLYLSRDLEKLTTPTRQCT